MMGHKVKQRGSGLNMHKIVVLVQGRLSPQIVYAHLVKIVRDSLANTRGCTAVGAAGGHGQFVLK